MVKNEKKRGFIEIMIDILGYIPKIMSTGILPSITECTESVMNTIEDKIVRVEKRMLKKIYSFLIIGMGGIFLIFALFFFLIDFLGWSRAVAFFGIGIIIFVIGLLLRIKWYDR